MGVMERCTRSAPCIFCGDVGYDMRVHYPEQEEVIHWCHKTNAAKGDNVIAGSDTYICISSGKQIDVGTFDLFVKQLSKEEWIEKQKRVNPDWKASGCKHGNPKEGGMKPQTRVLNVPAWANDSDSEILGEEKVLSPKILDKIYRAMLSLLVLEEKHKKALLKEWKSPVYDVSCILLDYPIRSMPPPDKARFANGESFNNPTRKHIVKKLLSMFGDLRGVPGFYLRSGPYWADKPESERWTFSSPEGIIFPCFDADGYLYRIRVRDDYPDLVLKEDKTESFQGRFGTFHYSYDKEGKRLLTFCEKEKKPEILHGVKPFGKVNGKYKNFSSVSAKLVDLVCVNTMEGGSRSGSPYSLYDKYSTSYTVVFGTEGEKKGMVANAAKRAPVVSVAGVWTYRVLFEKDESGKSFIDKMKEKGMKYFVVCYDADKETKDDVKRAEQAFVKELRENGVEPLIGYWKKDFDKGLDDILLAGIDILIGPP